MPSILDRVNEIAKETAANGPVLSAEQSEKKARQDARVSGIYEALVPLSGLCVRWGSGYATLDVLRQYGEAAVTFCVYERYEVAVGHKIEIRWRKTKHCATKWTFSPLAGRGVQAAFENGLLDYEEEAACMEDVARRIGPLVTTPPWEQ